MKKKSVFIIVTLILVLIVVVTAITKREKSLNSNISSQKTNITFESDKVNIYIFRGEGCPHCEEELSFLNSLNLNNYNIYDFEVWYNQDNANLMKEFAKAMGDEIKGVPYTIIGEKSFSGFDSSMEEEIIKIILEQSSKSFDIYKTIK